MSLWFQSSPYLTHPNESRQLGFGQITAMGPSFTAGGSEENSPMSSAAGGVTLNYGSRASISSNIDNNFNFDGPHFYNNSLTYQNNVNNNIFQNFVINNLMQFVRDVDTGGTGGGGGSVFSCSDLSTCGGSGTSTSITVLTSVYLNSSGLGFTRSTLNFNGYGLLTSITSTGDTVVSTIACS